MGSPHGEVDCRYSPELAGSMEPPALHLYLMPCSYDQSVPFERRLKLWTKRLTTWVQRCSQTSSPGSAQSWWPKYHTYTLYCRRHHHPYRVTINTIKNDFWSTNMIIHPCIFPANLGVAVENVKSERQMSGERNGRPQYNVSTLRMYLSHYLWLLILQGLVNLSSITFKTFIGNLIASCRVSGLATRRMPCSGDNRRVITRLLVNLKAVLGISRKKWRQWLVACHWLFSLVVKLTKNTISKYKSLSWVLFRQINFESSPPCQGTIRLVWLCPDNNGAPSDNSGLSNSDGGSDEACWVMMERWEAGLMVLR